MAVKFLSEVAAAWDETVFVGGYPAKEMTLARRDGEQWFVGNITASDSRTVKVALSFLPDGQRYNARIISDASGSSLKTREQLVTADATISVRVPETGGFVVRLSFH